MFDFMQRVSLRSRSAGQPINSTNDKNSLTQNSLVIDAENFSKPNHSMQPPSPTRKTADLGKKFPMRDEYDVSEIPYDLKTRLLDKSLRNGKYPFVDSEETRLAPDCLGELQDLLNQSVELGVKQKPGVFSGDDLRSKFPSIKRPEDSIYQQYMMRKQGLSINNTRDITKYITERDGKINSSVNVSLFSKLDENFSLLLTPTHYQSDFGDTFPARLKELAATKGVTMYTYDIGQGVYHDGQWNRIDLETVKADKKRGIMVRTGDHYDPATKIDGHGRPIVTNRTPLGGDCAFFSYLMILDDHSKHKKFSAKQMQAISSYEYGDDVRAIVFNVREDLVDFISSQ